MSISFRMFMESPDYCGLELSPLLAAVGDASEGIRPTTITDDECRQHFGCALDGLPQTPPRTVCIRSGGRSGKTSHLQAPKALHSAWTVPAPLLRRGEALVSAIVCPDTKLGKQALAFARGYVEDSPILRRALEEDTSEYLTLRRPDGHIARIEVLAASRGGRATRGRTFAFFGMDEACFFFDESTGVVNDLDIQRSGLQRIVPEGQNWLTSTPWVAGTGVLETTIDKDFGRHEHALAVVGGTRAFNPKWDPDGSIERSLRASDPDAALREIDGIPVSAGTSAYFEAHAVDKATELWELEWGRWIGAIGIGAGGDFAFVKNSSVCATACLLPGPERRVMVTDILELRPTADAPLKPSEVVHLFAKMIRAAGTDRMMADQHYLESVREHLQAEGLKVVPAPEGSEGKAKTYTHTRTLLHEGRLCLPNNPRLLRQMKDVIVKPTAGGGLSIQSPHKRDGSHGDLVSAVVLAVWALAPAKAPSRRFDRPRSIYIDAGEERTSTGFPFGYSRDRSY